MPSVFSVRDWRPLRSSAMSIFPLDRSELLPDLRLLEQLFIEEIAHRVLVVVPRVVRFDDIEIEVVALRMSFDGAPVSVTQDLIVVVRALRLDLQIARVAGMPAPGFSDCHAL